MANTLTNLIPSAYQALDIVSRELTGLISAVNLDAAAETFAKGQTIYSPVAPTGEAVADIAPAMTVTAATDQTIGTKSLAVDNFKVKGFNWTGEEEFGINTGPRLEKIVVDQLSQCFRAHVNAIETAVWTAAYKGASRAIGTTAGTAPILADFAGAKKILDDNGAPMTDRSVVLDTTAGVALRGISNLYKVNESGDTGLLRNGTLGSLYGFALRESAAILPVTKGAMTGALINAGNIAVGSTVLTFDTGTVNTTGIAAGDIITIGSGTNKYVVTTGATSTSGTITIAEPGLRVAIADNDAITVFGTSTRNLALSRNAITLATRLPKFQSGDHAADRQVITDPNSGISFELTMWPGQRMVKYEVAIAYGFTVIKPEHLAVIIG
jgi:hypothetical protein